MQNKIATYSFLISLVIVTLVCFWPMKLYAKDNSKISVVVIDPGHGGKDWGASVGSAKEKNIVLDIALSLGKLIQNNYPDIKVIYTRKSDVFIPLHKRAEIANKNEADVFISIHVNAVATKSVQGTETFVLGLHRNSDNLEVAKKENAVILLEDNYTSTYEGFDPNLPESYIMFETMQAEYQEQSIMLASNIQNEFSTKSKRVDRSVKMAGFLVLRRTTMPSVLIETGFLSHSSERQFLLSKTGQNSLATSIYNAFNSYKKEIEQHSKFSLVAKDVAPKPAERKPIKEQSLTADQSENIPEKNIKDSTETKTNNAEQVQKKPLTLPQEELYYSIQIMALKRQIETTPKNFKGETAVFSVQSNDFNRYYIGKYNSEEAAEQDNKRIKKKYPNAFVVAFRNKALISLKKAKEKR